MGYLESLLGQEERLVYATRHHWFLLLARGWAHALLLILGLAVAVGGNVLARPLLDELRLGQAEEVALRVGVAALLVVYPLAALVLRCIFWRDDRFVVTNLRVIHVEGILSKTVIDSSLEKVNDVLLRQSFLGRLLDFGDLEVLTGSEQGINRIALIHHPVRFKKAMLDAKQRLETAGGRPREATLPELLGQLAELRDRGVITQEEFEVEKAQLLAKM